MTHSSPSRRSADRPAGAINRLIDLLPMTFRADWGALVRRGGDGSGELRHATPAAPEKIEWYDVERAALVESGDENNLAAAAPLGDDQNVLLGRRGGPESHDSEL